MSREITSHAVPKVTRRAFLVSAAAAGGALTLGFDMSADAEADAPEITAWIVIAPDDGVTIRVARSEMGQGSFTALPMLVAEELGCDWSKVTAEFVAPEENLRRNRVWGDMSTGGSRSIRSSQEALRKAGATARAMLVAAAAAQWDVPDAECTAGRSIITHEPSGRTVRFGEIAAAAAVMAPPKTVRLKEPQDWTLIGTRRKRLEIADKVTGRPIYAIDVRNPGMLYAALAQCPVFRGKLKTADEMAIAGRQGIHKVVKFDDAIAVVADSWWRASQALDALPVTWDDGAQRAGVGPASPSRRIAAVRARRRQRPAPDVRPATSRQASRDPHGGSPPTTMCRISPTRRSSRRPAPPMWSATGSRSGCRPSTANRH